MALEEGLYQIRFVPASTQPPSAGGLFVDATELGEPVVAEPKETRAPQVWEVRRVADGKYTIVQPGFKTKHGGIGPVLLGWSLANPSKVYTGGSVFFKVDYVELDIEPVGEGNNLMYSVKVPNPAPRPAQLESAFYVTQHGSKLVSQAFWTNPEANQPHPHWQFIPVTRKQVAPGYWNMFLTGIGWAKPAQSSKH